MSAIKIIKVNATSSTNDKLKVLIKSKKITNRTILVAKYQYGGRGQYNNKWFSSYGKNLLCSLYFKKPKVSLKNSFLLNIAVSLAVLKTIKSFDKRQTFIKWPNDILSVNKKISGILIENIINGDNISYSVIGIGINVNQLIFKNLPKATSLKKLSNKDIKINNILNILIENLDLYLSKTHMTKSLLKEYNSNLFGKDQCNFIIKGKHRNGKVNHVKQNGNIEITLSLDDKFEFNSEKIKLIF